jgi:hypothetical protein
MRTLLMRMVFESDKVDEAAVRNRIHGPPGATRIRDLVRDDVIKLIELTKLSPRYYIW